MSVSLSDVLRDPATVCRVLQDELFGVTVAQVLTPSSCGGVVFDLSFDPLPELALDAYGVERCRVGVTPSGDVYAFPLGPPRSWRHRNPSPLGSRFGHLAAELCLWYPRDERGLRWDWADGFEQYVTRVYRHLYYEEYNRRVGEWPVEDAPHDTPPTGVHPVRSALMRREQRRWAA